MVQEKLPPHDNDSEEATIGSLLIDGEMMADIESVVTPDDFFGERNKWMFQACSQLYNRNEGINEITVARELAHDEKLDKIGGAAHLAHLIAICPTPFHVKYYAGIVAHLATYRRLISAGGEITRIGFQADADLSECLGRAENALMQVTRKRQEQGFYTPKDLAQYADERYFHPKPGRVEAFSTGFDGIDAATSGLFRGEMCVVAARTKMGKTTLVHNIAESIGKVGPVLMVPLEMLVGQTVDRVLSASSGVSMDRLRDVAAHHATLNELEEANLMDSIGHLAEKNWYVFKGERYTTSAIRSVARIIKEQYGLAAIVVDYLQLCTDRYGDSEAVRLAHISRELKNLATQLDVGVLAVSQISRALERQENRRPTLTDLKGSGGIEENADWFLFLYRDDYYNKHENPGLAEVIIPFHRSVPSIRDTRVFLRFSKGTNTYRDADVAKESGEQADQEPMDLGQER